MLLIRNEKDKIAQFEISHLSLQLLINISYKFVSAWITASEYIHFIYKFPNFQLLIEKFPNLQSYYFYTKKQ